jgi:hypothetical protein
MKRIYTNASFKGTYGFSIVFGAHAAIGLGVATSDGKGNFNGVQTLNLGGKMIPHTFSGAYSINPDGTGSAAVTFMIPDGSMQRGNFYYVVLEAKETATGKLATELQGFAVEPGFQGTLGLSHFSRIP